MFTLKKKRLGSKLIQVFWKIFSFPVGVEKNAKQTNLKGLQRVRICNLVPKSGQIFQ